MKPFLYKFFHEQTKDTSEGGLVSISKNKEDWPSEWSEIEYKEYIRSSKLTLPKVYEMSSLFSLLTKRTSEVDKIIKQVVTIEDIAILLKTGYGTISPNVSERRTVPSGGARFPLEMYLMVWGKVEMLPKGNYHYSIKKHELDVLLEPSVEFEEFSKYSKYNEIQNVHGAIVLSAVFDRTVGKYGSRGYRYILLEAGHVGQNICLGATERGLHVRPLGGIYDEAFERKLGLDSAFEQVVYVLLF